MVEVDIEFSPGVVQNWLQNETGKSGEKLSVCLSAKNRFLLLFLYGMTCNQASGKYLSQIGDVHSIMFRFYDVRKMYQAIKTF